MLPVLIRDYAETALTFVYPNVCQVCRDAVATKTEGYVCVGCWRNVRFIVPPLCDRCGTPFQGEISGNFECTNCREMDLQFSSAHSAVAAKGMVLDIIHRWKYSRAIWFEPFLAGLLVREAKPALLDGGWNCLVPVPLHPVRQAEREFNQAEHLVRHLSEATGIPARTDLVRRVNITATQTTLSRSERAQNMHKAFAPGPGREFVRGKRVVIVDDVLTTGATTSACAEVLKACGAVDVCVWTVARGLLD